MSTERFRQLAVAVVLENRFAFLSASKNKGDLTEGRQRVSQIGSECRLRQHAHNCQQGFDRIFSLSFFHFLIEATRQLC